MIGPNNNMYLCDSDLDAEEESLLGLEKVGPVGVITSRWELRYTSESHMSGEDFQSQCETFFSFLF